MCKVRLFEIVTVSQGKPVLLYTSLLEMSSLCPINLGMLCFHLHLSQGIFLFPVFVSTDCLVAYCLDSTFVFCSFFL